MPECQLVIAPSRAMAVFVILSCDLRPPPSPCSCYQTGGLNFETGTVASMEFAPLANLAKSTNPFCLTQQEPPGGAGSPIGRVGWEVSGCWLEGELVAPVVGRRRPSRGWGSPAEGAGEGCRSQQAPGGALGM